MYNTHMNNRVKQSLKNHKWVIGVSGGSDSMALLHMCTTHHIDIVVAHMNYKKRQTADRDMQAVIQYCEYYHIPYQIRTPSTECNTNFQAYAREERYAFYKDVIEKYQARGVLVAHQLEDHLETYLMQKKRKIFPTYFGIQEETYIKGCFVKRVLLAFTKEKLRTYCHWHQVIYHDDESNFSDVYMRNRIRHEIVDIMSIREKQKMCEEIRKENEELQKRRKKLMEYYEVWDASKEGLLCIPESYHVDVIDEMIFQTLGSHISRREVIEIYKQFLGNKNWTRRIKDSHEVSSAYGTLIVHKEPQTYKYVYHEISYVKTPYFEILKSGSKKDGLTIKKEEFPIIIRNACHDDKIKLRFGTKSIHRWFIDQKIPAYQRAMWPVIENCYQEIIFVPQIGCDIEHFSNNPSLFVIK